LPPIEVLVEMAYGSGMKNQAIGTRGVFVGRKS
jgi:hypothetical protein